MNTVTIGEVLWDVVGEDEHLGGATFNFSAHLSQLGHRVAFISAVGEDERGRRILDRMEQLGMSTRYVHPVAEYPTGLVTVTIDQRGQPGYVLHRPAAYDFPSLTRAEWTELRVRPADWLYYGTLHQISPTAHALTSQLLSARIARRQFYDVNLRAGCDRPALLRELMQQATVVKLNDAEVSDIVEMFGEAPTSLEDFCRTYAQRFAWEAVCVTRGGKGCALLIGGEYLEAPGYRVQVVDTVGSGDAFAAAFVHGFGLGWPGCQIADFANRAGALVASRRGAIPAWTVSETRVLKQA
jgi:fructokinase